jgi:hypothetical protein
VFFSSGECTALSALERIRDAVDVLESRRRPGRHGVRSMPNLRGDEASSFSPRPRRAARGAGCKLYSMPPSTLRLPPMLFWPHSLSYGARMDDSSTLIRVYDGYHERLQAAALVLAFTSSNLGLRTRRARS